MGFFVQGQRDVNEEVAALKRRVDKKNAPELNLDAYTGEYVNTVYGKINITRNGNSLVCNFQHHPDLVGYMDYMDNNEFRMTYNNIGYGIYPSKFTVANGKATSIEVKANPFVESDAYLFVKDPNNRVIR
jgi:hypothetical protein